MDSDASPGFVAACIGVVIALIIGVIWFFMFIGGWKSVPVDKVMLHYTGGPIQGTHFKEVVAPGTKTSFYGLLEHYYYLPSTQRTYIISANPNQGDVKGVDVVSAPSASPNSVPMSFEGAVYFRINTNPAVIRQFFEQICLHDNCTDLSPGGGWDKMLAQYFRPAMEQAFRTEAGKYTYEDLWHNPAVRQNMQDAIGPVLAADINANIGGEYFCGPDSTPTKCTPFGFVLQAANPPQNVIDAFAATAAATQNLKTVAQQNAATVSQATAAAQAQNARAGAAAVPPSAAGLIKAQAEADCAKNPNCKLVIIDGAGSNVQVAP